MQQRHQIFSLMRQGIFVQMIDVILSRVVIVMPIYKGKIVALNIAVFSKNCQISIVGQHFVNAVH